MTDGGDLASRTLSDIDLTGPTPVFAVDLDRQVLVADLLPGSDPLDVTAARLARVERLLEADLAALGPSVVAASIEEITTRLDALAISVELVASRWAAADEELGATVANRFEARLDGLDKRIDRLTRLVEAATEPLPDDDPAAGDPALRTILERVDALTAEVARLTAIADRVGAED